MKHHVNAIIRDDFWQVVKEEKPQEGDFEEESLMSFGGSHWCRSTPSHEHRSTEVLQNRSTSSHGHRSTTPKESTTSCNTVRIMTHEEFAAKHPHPPSPVYVKIDRHFDPVIDRHQETAIDRQPPAPIDRRAPITYRVQMPKIDVARLNALRPKPKPSENPPEAVRTPSKDETDSMEADRVPTGSFTLGVSITGCKDAQTSILTCRIIDQDWTGFHESSFNGFSHKILFTSF
ncbi:hypothetical protein F2Q69_00022204 [Brassica cretica]|uniref:Uncharacterized protein n=1 Tax=Brassica cretica TaxID=69181 RepID=A0A8S9Q6P7_BRACR|nr:hypothetical protein F2Q69_00022204 [Brassica cretica]